MIDEKRGNSRPAFFAEFRFARRSIAFVRGFTLLEILVVVAILAIAAGTALLVVDRDERSVVAREARRFAGAIEYAAARAQMRGETVGIGVSDAGWRFYVLAPDGKWAPLSGDDALAARALPTPLTAQALAYAGRAIEADAIVPLRASGRNDPFAFVLTTTRWRATLSSDPLARVTIAGPEAAAP
jgi:general secretion pathway protein H